MTLPCQENYFFYTNEDYEKWRARRGRGSNFALQYQKSYSFNTEIYNQEENMEQEKKKPIVDLNSPDLFMLVTAYPTDEHGKTCIVEGKKNIIKYLDTPCYAVYRFPSMVRVSSADITLIDQVNV